MKAHADAIDKNTAFLIGTTIEYSYFDFKYEAAQTESTPPLKTMTAFFIISPIIFSYLLAPLLGLQITV